MEIIQWLKKKKQQHTENYVSIWKLNNSLLNKPWTTEEIKEQIK